VNISKIEAKITGLKADGLIDIGNKVDEYLESHCADIAKLLEDNMNELLHQYVDPWACARINKACKQHTPSELQLDGFINDVLVSALREALGHE